MPRKRKPDPARGMVRVVDRSCCAQESDIEVRVHDGADGVWVPVIIDAERPGHEAEQIRRAIRRAITKARAKRGR